MSFYVLASGALIADPQCRAGAKGAFTTATIRANGDEAVLVSVIAFGDEAGRLLEFVKGDALAVSGRARLTSWTSPTFSAGGV
jgi:single-stranded DNA-binding protein